MSNPLATRQFDARDQYRFAELSGDRNPIHLDAVEARRSFLGVPIVHGVHCVLWALESYLLRLSEEGAARPLRLTHLNFKLPNPVRLQRQITASLIKETEGQAWSARLRLQDGQQTVADILLEGEVAGEPGAAELSALSETPVAPQIHAMDDIDGLAGSVALAGDAAAFRQAFPQTCAILGVAPVARLTGLSRLVGLECPGRYSLLFAADMIFLPGPDTGALEYAVHHAERKLSRVQIALSGAACRGKITAFLRPAPVAQPALAAIAGRIDKTAMADRKALIVGGSRGLGEAAAKILAASGSDMAITYFHGAEDAARVRDEINAWGGRCRAIRLDVASPDNLAGGLDGWPPDQLYYFATPAIFGPRVGAFDRARLDEFLSCYVSGFDKVYRALRPLVRGGLDIFYPSSVAVEVADRETVEYAAAKLAGESLCREIARQDENVNILVKRLARINTDQTASLRHFEAEDAVTVMTEIVREMTVG